MAKRFTYPPIRPPVKWGQEERSVITQIHKIFDTIPVGSGSGAGYGDFMFEINSEGHLILLYETTTPPNFYIDSSGHLIHQFEEV